MELNKEQKAQAKELVQSLFPPVKNPRKFFLYFVVRGLGSSRFRHADVTEYVESSASSIRAFFFLCDMNDTFEERVANAYTLIVGFAETRRFHLVPATPTPEDEFAVERFFKVGMSAFEDWDKDTNRGVAAFFKKENLEKVLGTLLLLFERGNMSGRPLEFFVQAVLDHHEDGKVFQEYLKSRC